MKPANKALLAKLRGHKEPIANSSSLVPALPLVIEQPEELYAAALQERDIKKITLAIQHGANPTRNPTTKKSRITEAVALNWPELLTLLLNNGGDANYHGRISPPPLVLALQRQQTAMAHQLLAASSKTNLSDNNLPGASGETALTLALGQAGLVAAMLAAGANPNLTNRDGTTPLQVAALLGYAEDAQCLLEAGANPLLVHGDYGNALDAAWLRYSDPAAPPHPGRAETIRLLLRAGIEPGNMTIASLEKMAPGDATLQLIEDTLAANNVLRQAAEGVGQIAVALAAGAQANTRSIPGNIPVLARAAERQDWDGVLALLQAGADANVCSADATRPLHYAVLAGRHDMVQALLQAGAKIGALYPQHQDNALGCAARMGNIGIIKDILCHDATATQALPGALAAAIEAGLDAVARWIILHHLRADYLHPSGLDALGLAASCNRLDLVREMLADDGGRVNVLYHQNRYNLAMLACAGGAVDVLQYLLQHGQGVELPPMAPTGLGQLAARSGSVACLELLAAAGIDMLAVDEDGASPLHYAAGFHRIDAMGWLLARGADVNQSDASGATPLHRLLAHANVMDRQHADYLPRATAALWLLLDAGADLNASDGTRPNLPTRIHRLFGDAVANQLLVFDPQAPRRLGAKNFSPKP